MARTVGVSVKPKAVTYRYEAYSDREKLVKGTVKATSEIEAERLIIRKGYNPARVEVAPSMFSLEEALPTLFKVKPRDVIVFSRLLATLLRSGISLLPALAILQEQAATSRVFKKTIESIVYDIRSGSSFSQAIRKYPRVFNDIYCRTIAVGERSGNLETVLQRMADHQERQSAFGQKIGKALVYPIMVLGVAAVVIVVLMVAVMPQLLGMFTAMQAELPITTKILIGMTNFVTAQKFYLLIAAATLSALVLWMVSLPMGRRLLDRLRLRAPILGPPALMWELARFSRTLSVLVGTGMNLQEIMEMLPQSTNNRVMRDALIRVNDGLLLGEGLTGPMSSIDIFPPLLIQMVAVGEESNTLDFTMGVVADFCEASAEEKTSAIVGMLGPVSTIFIALVVGFIALSVIMPIYSLTGAFG